MQRWGAERANEMAELERPGRSPMNEQNGIPLSLVDIVDRPSATRRARAANG